MVLRTTAGISIHAEVVISPAINTSPVVVAASQATRAIGSCAKIASSTPSEIWSHSLSGCPSVTDSLVKNDFGLFIKLLILHLLLSSERSFATLRMTAFDCHPERREGSALC